MSRDGSVTLTFLDGEDYVFRLAVGQLMKLQEARNCGPYEILLRLHGEGWRVEDITEVIRWGLVGGGMNEIRAKKMVREYVEHRPPMSAAAEASPLSIAQAVIHAGMIMPEEDDPLKKARADPSASTTSPTDGSASPSFSVSAH